MPKFFKFLAHFDHPNVGVLYHPNGRSVQFGPVQLQSQLLIPSSPANAFGLRQQKPVTGIVAPAAAIAVDEPNSDDKWLISSALRGSAFTGSSGNARYAAFSVSNPYQPTGTLNLLVPKNFVRTKKKDAYTVVYPVTSTTLPSEVEPITVATADVRNFLSVTVSDVLTGATPVPSQEDLQTLLQTLFGCSQCLAIQNSQANRNTNGGLRPRANAGQLRSLQDKGLPLRATHRQNVNAPAANSGDNWGRVLDDLLHPNGRSVQFAPPEGRLIGAPAGQIINAVAAMPSSSVPAPAAALASPAAITVPGQSATSPGANPPAPAAIERAPTSNFASSNPRYAAFSVSQPYQQTATFSLMIQRNSGNILSRYNLNNRITTIAPALSSSTTSAPETPPAKVTTAWSFVDDGIVSTPASPRSQEDLQTLLRTLFGW
ncbi:uncharacterized protein LOC129581317 isoform X2 [Paramacrobiotus metropolitanus]|uniref:uncharacterized protein LOC129581317 isoform X2 n=1 Tax=Paramacrobiotus metropolitanus TaxID=2943436 RepID=UPI0024455EF9|nr:uncharacterized protein LOC129581317 isoform X2 [Paramacrobiotus metropolitanus]